MRNDHRGDLRPEKLGVKAASAAVLPRGGVSESRIAYSDQDRRVDDLPTESESARTSTEAARALPAADSRGPGVTTGPFPNPHAFGVHGATSAREEPHLLESRPDQAERRNAVRQSAYMTLEKRGRRRLNLFSGTRRRFRDRLSAAGRGSGTRCFCSSAGRWYRYHDGSHPGSRVQSTRPPVPHDGTRNFHFPSAAPPAASRRSGPGASVTR